MLCWLLAAMCGGLHAQSLPAEKLAAVGFEQRLGAALPLDRTFIDESGRAVNLGSYFGQKPVLLALAYYQCPSLCTVVLNGLLDGVRGLKLEAGRDFEIVVVSIEPNDSPKLAAAKRQAYSGRYGRSGAGGWHFLTGTRAGIDELAAAVGFHYERDAQSGQYAHPSGIVVATPEGKISRYFLGIEYPSSNLRLALVEASRGQIGTLADRLLLVCFHFNPVTGRYGLVISRVIQAAGIGTVATLAGFIVWLRRRELQTRGSLS